MLNQKELIAYLRANNISMANPDTIKRNLLKRDWNAEDVNSALLLLRASGVFAAPTHFEQPIVAGEQIQQVVRSSMSPSPALSKRTLYSNQKLDSATITKLLGVDVDISDETRQVRRVLRTPRMTTPDQFIAFFIATVLSAAILFSAMYYYKFGLFHSTSEFATHFSL